MFERERVGDGDARYESMRKKYTEFVALAEKHAIDEGVPKDIDGNHRPSDIFELLINTIGTAFITLAARTAHQAADCEYQRVQIIHGMLGALFEIGIGSLHACAEKDEAAPHVH